MESISIPHGDDLSTRGSLQSVLLSKGGEICRRYHDVEQHFPQIVVHAPGRVNIIGEHIDYCGYAVFPMALEQGIVIAAQPRDDGQIILKDDDSEKYSSQPPFSLDDIRTWSRDFANPQWQDYVRCGLRGCFEVSSELSSGKLRGLTMLVGGNLPAACGVSSSSALVIASALVAAVAWDVKTSRVALAEACARAERYVGTEGGGMDQAISLLAEAGAAKLVEFNPLKTTSVKLPPGAIFVVCNSMITMEKAATAEFNTRVVECRLACHVIAHKEGLDWRKFRVMKTLQDHLGKSFAEMLDLVKEHIRDEAYTRQEVCDLLGTSVEELTKASLNEQTKNYDAFLLKKRALHVFSEAERVWDFKRVCEDEAGGEGRLVELGRLMNASHYSCRDFYACSHPQLDELQSVAEKHCFGARLTGAGWGGCLVALVPSEKLNEFKEAVQAGYYSKYESLKRGRSFEELVFATAPAGGATAVQVQPEEDS